MYYLFNKPFCNIIDSNSSRAKDWNNYWVVTDKILDYCEN